MKKIIYILSLFAVLPLFFSQCDSEDDLITENAKEGGLMDVLTPFVNLVVGNTNPYTFSMKIYQGTTKTTQVFFYKSFYSVADDTIGGSPWSNEVLVATIDINEANTHNLISPAYAYADLRDGLTFQGNPLPESDSDLNIGDAFYFRIVNKLDNGSEVQQVTKVKLTVATRFAGKYKVIDAEYFRIGVLTYTESDWPSEIDVESVDAITYKMTDYNPFLGDQSIYFQIDATGAISFPLKWQGADQILNDLPIITCADNAGDMTFAHCATSNYVVKDDVGGKDILYQSYGYYTPGSGSREFYQVLEKIVE